MPCPPARLRGVRTGAGLPVLRRGAHRSRRGRRAGAGAGDSESAGARGTATRRCPYSRRTAGRSGAMSPRAGMSASAKTGIGVLIVFVAIIVALVKTVVGDGGTGTEPSASAAASRGAGSDGAGPDGAGPGSPEGAAADSDAPLAGITLTDLGDGGPVDLSSELA